MVSTLVSLSVIVAAVVLAKSAAVKTGLTCLECRNVVQPRHCRNAVTCPPEHYCGSEKIMASGGAVAYNVGCRHKQVCSAYRNHSNTGSQQFGPCTECCEFLLCNGQSCGEPGFPKTRGPLCYQCEDYKDVTTCNHITQCATDEVCYIEQMLVYADLVYISGCKLTHLCSIKNPVPGVGPHVGKRFLDNHVTPVACAMCCEGDTCNSYCGNTGASTATTTTMSTSIANATATNSASTTIAISSTVTTSTVSVGPPTTTTPPDTGSRDCRDVYESGRHVSGVYSVKVNVSGLLQRNLVYCDMDTPPGGWTVFQKRVNGSVDFYRNFNVYESGFGDLHGEFWLGLKWVYWMTLSRPSALFINLTATSSGKETFVRYGSFSLGSPPGYRLAVSSGSGTNPYDGLVSRHNGSPFSTRDHDVDNHAVSCAEIIHAGYWFSDCNSSNLNGNYGGDYNTSFSDSGFYWKPGNQLTSALSSYTGMNFATYDDDVDIYNDGNCAEILHDGYWFHPCYKSNFNGNYGGT